MTSPSSPHQDPRREARRRRRAARRASLAVTAHGHGPDPIFWSCPRCQADPRQRCRVSIAPLPVGRNYHAERIPATGPGYVKT